jgi:hypothetical protein
VSLIKALAISLVGLVLLVGGVLYFLQSKLFAATDTPPARVRSEPLALRTITSELRLLDLGFSSFAIPKTVPGQLAQVNDTLFINLSSEGRNPLLTICAPFFEHDDAVQHLLAQLRITMGVSSISWFEPQKRTLEVQPFNIFGAIAKGRKASVRDLTLLLIKKLSFGSALGNISVFENENTGAFVYRAEIGSFVEVHDKKTGLSQLIIVSPKAGDPNEVASTIIQTYRTEAGIKTDDELLKRLRATGISRTPQRAESTTQLEDERLAGVAEEVRKRRIERSR